MNTTLPLDRQELIDRIATGEQFEFYFFWGHTPPKDGSVNKSCLSQWFNAGFNIDGVPCKTAEHWMMAEKARLFSDQIITAPTPKKAKSLGRKLPLLTRTEMNSVA